MSRSLKVTITSIRRRTISAQTGTIRAWCAACGREVELFTRAQAASVIGADSRTLDGFIAVGRVHAVQTVSGSVWLCKDSLFLR